MGGFSFKKTSLEGVWVIEPLVIKDERGYFIKDYALDTFEQNGIEYTLKEVFYTESKKGVVRGIHFQHTKEQAKLVRCIRGYIYDVVVDLRVMSPTFGQFEAFRLKGSKPTSLLIPYGFGHGYMVLEDAIVSYKCNEVFYKAYDSGILWNDKMLNIDWPLDEVDEVILSDKDRQLQTLKAYKEGFR